MSTRRFGLIVFYLFQVTLGFHIGVLFYEANAQTYQTHKVIETGPMEQPPAASLSTERLNVCVNGTNDYTRPPLQAGEDATISLLVKAGHSCQVDGIPTAATTTAKVFAWAWRGDTLTWEDITGGDSANDTVFIGETALAPATAGEPTLSEIEAYAAVQGWTDRLVQYTATDTPTDPQVYAYWLDKSGVAVRVNQKATPGLPQQGELPAAVLTQGIYSANGTNTATVLPAATGSQDRVMIHATTAHGSTVIGVQPGESLLRVGDSTYTTQAPGELLLFIDSEVGNWDMNIVGNAISVSSRVGEMFFAPAGSTRLGVLAMTPGTVTGGALAYPVWAAMYPEFVSGNDIVFPPDVAGMFLRNLGGDAANEGVFQADRFRSHQHVGGKPVYGAEAAFGATTGGGGNGGVSNWDGSVANRPLTSFTGGDETNPANRAYQLYVIVDNYDVRAMEGLAAAAPIQEGSNANGSWQDVGTWRTQRGTFSGAGVDALVTFPQPFADTSYQCTTAIVDASTSTISASVQSKTTTGFNLRRRFINLGSQGEATENTDWTCIGLL